MGTCGGRRRAGCCLRMCGGLSSSHDRGTSIGFALKVEPPRLAGLGAARIGPGHPRGPEPSGRGRAGLSQPSWPVWGSPCLGRLHGPAGGSVHTAGDQGRSRAESLTRVSAPRPLWPPLHQRINSEPSARGQWPCGQGVLTSSGSPGPSPLSALTTSKEKVLPKPGDGAGCPSALLLSGKFPQRGLPAAGGRGIPRQSAALICTH